MKTLNITKSAFSAIIVWVLGVSAYVSSYFIPILDNPDAQASWVLIIALIPATILGAHFYYRRGYKTNGLLLGSFMFLITILLDACITVPVFIIPNGGSHLTFFGELEFWLIGLEYITLISIYWLTKR